MFKIITSNLVNTLIPERLRKMIDRSMAKKNANLSKNKNKSSSRALKDVKRV